ncbi:MAG: helix-hairpin-helix domain-containing protein [Anaerolineae bacterium]
MTTEMQGNLPIDVNTASSDDLLPIDGIGPALAQRIVQYRREHGPFADLDELVAVPGIGRALLARIRPQITLTPAPEAAGLAEIPIAGKSEPAQLAGPLQVSEEPEPEAAAPPPAARDTDAGHGFWGNFLLVAGGAIIGALVMLLVLLAYSGTLSYASRKEVEALSRNLDTIYHNSEIAWERLDRLAADNADLSAKVDRLMELSGRVAELEQGTQEMRDDLTATQNSISALESDLAELRKTYGTRFDEMDATLDEQGKRLDQMESDLAEARATMEAMQQQLTTYDTFFGALRDLLIDMQGLPTDEAGPAEAPVPEKEASGS